ncbi:hypothetical protein F4677DRAFT_451251 [Hypoxylon crocopeplum]|nr:hypothetical protein F4677DRAFT_451251 [Hypoxylon crocopeplum]
MATDQYILRQCQVEECEATIFIRGPYCTEHTRTKGLIQFPTTPIPSFTSSQRSSSSDRPPQQNSPQSNFHSATMAPQEKLGDAITVKTSLTPQATTSEKSDKSDRKQLPDKKVARKTISTSSSKPKKSPAVTRNPDPRASLDHSSVRDATSSGQRPLKRRRLSLDADKADRGARHPLPSSTEGSSHAPSRTKPAHFENDDIGFTAASTFTLHPNKGKATPLEIPPRPKAREGAEPSSAKPAHKDPVRHTKKQNIRPREVIDLTGDDPEPQVSASNGHGGSHTGASKGRGDRSGDSRITEEATTGSRPESRLGSQNEGRSIKVHTSPEPRAEEPTIPIDAPSRNEQNGVRKDSSNSGSRIAPKKPNNANIAPHPRPTLLPSDFRFTPLTSQAKSVNRKTATVHLSAAPPTISTSSTTGDCIGSRFGSSSRTQESVETFSIQASEATALNESGLPSETRDTSLDASLPRPKSRRPVSPAPRSRDKEPSIAKPIGVRNPQATHPRISTQRPQIVQKEVQPPTPISQGSEDRNGVDGRICTPAIESTLASMLRKRSWRHLDPEERRQVWISKHDPEKFDSYIYGKLNEPNRPGSALFDLPEWQQQREIRPATHFAHIDPRVHWTHPRSKKWYREKQEEIRRRGTRKSNMGKAASRAAQQRLEEGDDPPRVDLPDRVKNSPAWLAALDELDEIAEQYHAKKRGEREARRKRSEQKEKEKEPSMADDDDKMDVDSS